jgi:AcrR family transcriptional regulator
MTTYEPSSSTAPGDRDPLGSAHHRVTSRRPRARKGEGIRLRDEILMATEQLLLQTGSSEAVSIRAVADAVGVTPPSIYRHFPDKQTLIYEVCSRHFNALYEHIQQGVAGIDDPIEAMVARGRAYVHYGLEHPEPYRIMFMTRPEGSLAEEEEWIRTSATFLDALKGVQDCIDSGRLRPNHTDAFRTCLGFWARVHGLTSLAVSKPFLGIDDAFIDEYVDDCLRGIVASRR